MYKIVLLKRSKTIYRCYTPVCINICMSVCGCVLSVRVILEYYISIRLGFLSFCLVTVVASKLACDMSGAYSISSAQ